MLKKINVQVLLKSIYDLMVKFGHFVQPTQ